MATIKKYFTIASVIVLWSLLFFNPIFAEDGDYDAYVTTKDGTYSASVVVESGKITMVRWQRGVNTIVSTGEIVEGVANGTDADGNPISIEVEDYY